MYICVKLPPTDLNPDLYPPPPTRTLNLWSDHHVKGLQW